MAPRTTQERGKILLGRLSHKYIALSSRPDLPPLAVASEEGKGEGGELVKGIDPRTAYVPNLFFIFKGSMDQGPNELLRRLQKREGLDDDPCVMISEMEPDSKQC